MREKFFKNEWSENISQKWPVKDWVTLILFSIEMYEWKNIFRWFRWWMWQSTWSGPQPTDIFGGGQNDVTCCCTIQYIRLWKFWGGAIARLPPPLVADLDMIIEGHWANDDIEFSRRLCKDLCKNCTAYCLCVWIFLVLFRASVCFAYGQRVINQRNCRVEKSAFEDQSEENSVCILKLTTLLGILLQNMIYTCCYPKPVVLKHFYISYPFIKQDYQIYHQYTQCCSFIKNTKLTNSYSLE